MQFAMFLCNIVFFSDYDTSMVPRSIDQALVANDSTARRPHLKQKKTMYESAPSTPEFSNRAAFSFRADLQIFCRYSRELYFVL